MAKKAPSVDDTIVSAAIYPAIGVARVGNSPQEWFYGPEVPDPPPQPAGFYRDKTGALKRQAARFRVYGLNAAGLPVKELTGAKGAEVEWTVHLANQKASWYEFQLALDIPEAAAAPPSYRRNAQVKDRASLTIDPGPRSLAGAGKGPVAFDDGEFVGKRVYLGELRTDEAGRLVVLGGHGKSASYNGAPAVTFGNNDGWHDDVADGPVTASVRWQGKDIQVTPAWIVVGPPNYAPQQKSVRTMWDLMRDIAYDLAFLKRPARPSFTGDILPIFERLSRLQWVNAGFARGFGWGSPFDFTSPDWQAKLADGSASNQETRRQLYNQFRQGDRDSWSPVPWPWVYGDAMSVPAARTPRQFTQLTETQLGFLKQWVAGDFINDYDPTARPPASLDKVPVERQPDMLDRASLEFCLADAFHPGCEMTWPVRSESIFMGAYRFLHAPAGSKEPDYGPVMTSEICGTPDGPLYGQRPGSISRWMAVPWQTDTASCRSGYDTAYDPYLPTFWPARVPNQVLTPSDYKTVMNKKLPAEERLAAFARRASWNDPLGKGTYISQINNLANNIDIVAVVDVAPGPGDLPLPKVMEVADREAPPPALLKAGLETDGAPPDLSKIEKVRRFTSRVRL
ncbi:LodA/GoxA family CTQ-dependent oxidase [Niveispirillum fermenti]|uniref:LodA/GoxA family CTQ-dependent oxidase n=1 Tax=Niveispirillum fermenti TaxID=1233113 RepID=UPI003A89EB9B